MTLRRDAALLPAAVALIAGAALAYQLLLMRGLAIAHWHPFAALIISLALLGHGASGTLLAMLAARGRTPALAAFPIAAAAFALAAPACHALAQRLPFNGLELVWNPAQLGWLSLLYLLLSLPFFAAAFCIALAFLQRPQQLHGLYAADLAGAGAGAVAVIALLFVVSVESALKLVAAAGLLAAVLVLPVVRSRTAAIAAVAAAAALLAFPAAWLQPRISEYKGLPRMLAAMGAQVVDQQSSPYGLLTLIENRRVPLRHAPGVGLTNPHEPPQQLGLFTDGEGMTAIARSAEPAALGYLDHSLSAAPYALQPRPRVLLLGAGGGAEILQALRRGAQRIDAVEPNPQVVDLLRAAPGLDAAGVALHAADPRAFVRATDAQYDLVVLGAADSLLAGGAGTQSAAEAYAYTVEALADYRARLAPGGVLAVPRWEKLPPRDLLKLVASARRVLDAAGAVPAGHLAVLRNWDQSVLLLARDALTPGDRTALRAFADAEGFRLVIAGAPAGDDVLQSGFDALLGDDEASFRARYKFHIDPATDARPYFQHFFKWQALPELWRLREQGGAVLLDSGYLLLVAALAQALPLAALLALLPLAVRRSRTPAARPGVYFLCLGLGFLFIEIAFIQQLTLLVGHPLLAATSVLAAFLCGAGAGSALSPRWQARWRQPQLAAALAIGLALIVLAAAVPSLTARLAGMDVALRAGAAVVCILPLAVLMGLPFPLGMARIAASDRDLVPWAWGVNGSASVLSAILAALLAVHVGWLGLLAAAGLLYLVGALAWREPHSAPS